MSLVDSYPGLDGEVLKGEFFCSCFRKNYVLLGTKNEIAIGIELRRFLCFTRWVEEPRSPPCAR